MIVFQCLVENEEVNKSIFSAPLALLCLLPLACTSPSRTPSSASRDSDRAQRIQELNLEISTLWNRQFSITQQIEQQPSRAGSAATDPRKMNLDALIASKQAEREAAIQELSSSMQTQSWNGTGPWFETQFATPLMERTEEIKITQLDNFLIKEGPRPPFPLEHRFFSNYTLRIVNLLPSGNDGSGVGQGSGSNNLDYLVGHFECDADMLFDSGLLFSRETRARVYDFNIYNSHTNDAHVKIRFTPAVNRCTLTYRALNSPVWTHQIQLAALDEISPAWMSLSRTLEVCARPMGFVGNDPVSFFWNQDFNQVTCPRPYEKLDFLRDPYKALNAKVRGLTGINLPPQVLADKDPLARLDFSRAPEFDIIWVSSLNFSADFYGSTLLHALRHHAERGTQIRILIPAATTTRKDTNLLQHFIRDMPNVKLQEYEYTLSRGTNGSWLDEFHRVNHAKLVIGYSTRHPENNFVVTGGRNIRDSYLFHDKPMYRRFPWLKNYAAGEEPFIYYDDFEVELRGTPLVRSILAQMISLWNRNLTNQLFRSTNLNLSRQTTSDQIGRIRAVSQVYPMVRHVLSLPYVDGYQLEKFYVQMFDSAQKEILLTTPYFKPTLAISEAFDRAAKRGVTIKVLTRIHLAGDGTPRIAEDVNKQGINRHLANLEIYEWTDPNSILHAKLLVIDSKLSFISSVNINNRSFVHDIESGVLILHEKTARDFRAEVLDYFKKAARITEARRVQWLNGVVLDFVDSYF